MSAVAPQSCNPSFAQRSMIAENAALRRRLALYEQDMATSSAARFRASLTGRLPSLDNSDLIAQGQQWLVPVTVLRFTHDTIDAGLRFANKGSMYKLLDQLQRSELTAETLEPMDVVYHEGNLWSMSNRRLAVLLQYQALHRDRVVSARCVRRSTDWKNGKFYQSKTTNNGGLGIDAHASLGSVSGDSLHTTHNLPLFDPGLSAWKLLNEVLGRDDYQSQLARHPDLRLRFLKLRDSQNLPGTHSISVAGTMPSIAS